MAETTENMDEGGKGGMNKKLLLLTAFALAIVGGGGGAMWFLAGEGAPFQKSGSSPVEAAIESEPDPAIIGPVVDLEPFVLNLADQDRLRYLKVTIKLQLDRPQEETDFQVRLPAIRDALLVLLTSKESQALRTVDGKMLVRDEIGGRVNTIMKKGKISQVFFSEFVIQ